MSLRVLLVCHGATAATRRAVFGGDGPLLEGADRRLAALRDHLPKARAVLRSEARCAEDTAVALGLDDVAEALPAVGDWDFGVWRGRSLAEVEAEAPEDVARWRTDPAGAPHGGECLRDVLGRVSGWLDGLQGEGTRTVVTHPAVIRAAVVHGLAVPEDAFWTIDVAPTSVTELLRRGSRWRVARINWEPELFRQPRPRRAAAAGAAS